MGREGRMPPNSPEIGCFTSILAALFVLVLTVWLAW